MRHPWESPDTETHDPRASASPETIASTEWALAQVPREDDWLIRRLFWEGRSEAEVARDLGITQQAVSKRRARALRRLRAFC